MRETIRGLSNERLESEIANVYWTAWEMNPRKTPQERKGSLLKMLWTEWDYRVRTGVIDLDDYWTGSEVLEGEDYNRYGF